MLIEISQNEKTTILFEAPHRLKKLLTDLKFYCGGERIIHISRELTKRFEENINTDINNAIKLFENREAIGEFTLIIKGKYKSKDIKFDKISLKNDLHELVNAGLSLSSAAKYLAKKRNVPKSWRLSVRDIKVSNGAGFIVALTGKMMLMPGMPRESAVQNIDIDSEGIIKGLS